MYFCVKDSLKVSAVEVGGLGRKYCCNLDGDVFFKWLVSYLIVVFEKDLRFFY